MAPPSRGQTSRYQKGPQYDTLTGILDARRGPWEPSGADYLITGGLVVSGEGISRQDIVVHGERIHQMAPDLTGAQARRVIDASGKYVLPGLVDAHSHPINTDRIDTYSLSAAFGGVTTVVPFIQNLRSRGIDGSTLDAVRGFIEEGERTSCLDFGVHAVLFGDDDVEDQVPQLIGMGVVSFKMFMTYPRRGMMMPDEKMIRAMELAAEGGGLAMVHAENGYATDYLVDKFTAQGKTTAEYFAPFSAQGAGGGGRLPRLHLRHHHRMPPVHSSY